MLRIVDALPPPAVGGDLARSAAEIQRAVFAAPSVHPPVRCYLPHAVIVREGDPARDILEVVEGCVTLTRWTDDGRRQIVDVLGRGDAFGLARGARHDCTAEALTATRIRSLRWPELASDADGTARVLDLAACSLSRQHCQALLLGRRTAMERVSAAVLRLEQVIGDRGDGFECPMTRQDLADWLGLVLETVSRNLNVLAKRRLIEIRHHTRFKVLDRRALRTEAGQTADTPFGLLAEG
ncbi:helix-turn-helix domain-containing protein [Methyloraptor flagellatus]|uniref:Helix-turn-helix domain-containing protein n=1 Tax=Methyloraptor flagellatus TaxID=3162530 RepID=A0AAU7X5Q3_9HYPH